MKWSQQTFISSKILKIKINDCQTKNFDFEITAAAAVKMNVFNFRELVV